MPKQYVATVHILLPRDVQDEASACDWMSGLLTEHSRAQDWTYANAGGPHEIDVPVDYAEGDFIGEVEIGHAKHAVLAKHISAIGVKTAAVLAISNLERDAYHRNIGDAARVLVDAGHETAMYITSWASGTTAWDLDGRSVLVTTNGKIELRD